MAPHSSTLAWKISWTDEPGKLQSMGLLGVRHDWANSLSHIVEGNGNPFQCSCLENPRDGGAWWAAISGVAQSWTQLKWLSSIHNVIVNIARFQSHVTIFYFFFDLFLAVLGLCCCRSFSLVAASRGLLSHGMWASHCGGLSCFRTLAPGCLGFSSCDSQTLGRRLNGCGAQASLLRDM